MDKNQSQRIHQFGKELNSFNPSVRWSVKTLVTTRPDVQATSLTSQECQAFPVSSSVQRLVQRYGMGSGANFEAARIKKWLSTARCRLDQEELRFSAGYHTLDTSGHIDVPKTELVMNWLILQVQRRRDSGVCGVCGVCASEPVCVCVRMCIAVPK
jgi:hypothetical protein